MTEEGSTPDPADDRSGDSPETTEYFSDEKRRSVPKAAWWTLGAALAVLLVLLVARPTWFTQDADDHSLKVPPDRHFTKTLAGSGHADGVWLTDDSPSTSYLVTLPADSTRSQTRMHLLGSSQIAENSTVFLSVSLDGQQVYNQELAAGTGTVDSYIDVPGQIAADGQVRVQIRAQGTRHDETCTLDHSSGMQIHLDPDSVVEAALDSPVHTVRDAVVSWDRDVTVVLTDPGDAWRTAAAQLGMALIRSGHRVHYSDAIPENDIRNAIFVGPSASLTAIGWTAPDNAAGDDGITVGTADGQPVLAVTVPDGPRVAGFVTAPTVTTADRATSTPTSVTTTPGSPTQVPLAALGTDMSVGQITDTRRWRVRYSLADLPGGRLPQTVQVSMTLPDSPDDLTWILNADLNGRLIASRALNPTAGQTTIALPPQNALLDNELTLSVERDRNLGGCDVRVTSYPIQMGQDSALVMGDDPGAGFTAVPRTLSPGFDVFIPDADTSAVRQLNAIVPTLTAFVPAQYNPRFRWRTQPEIGKPFILVGESPSVAPTVRIENGRIVTGENGAVLDIPQFENGLVVQNARGGGSAGLVVQYTGSIGDTALPDFGTEAARVVTTQGSFAIAADGTVLPTTPARQGAPG